MDENNKYDNNKKTGQFLLYCTKRNNFITLIVLTEVDPSPSSYMTLYEIYFIM